MRIVMISENDPAGMGIAFTNAINRCTDHRCRLITTQTRYNFEFEKDLHVPDLDPDGFDAIVDLIKNADIIHFHILADENLMLGPIRVKDQLRGQTLVHHHHGHPDFRANPAKYREKYRRLKRKVFVSTPDLLRLLPEAVWQPNLVPIDAPLYKPSETGSDGRVRICQSPTRKDLKNTDDLRAVLIAVSHRYDNVEGVIIENTNHRECLRIKQTCDIHFDHMQGYFGVSSLESLSQGKPVIAGLDDWNLQWVGKFTGADEIPWVVARDADGLSEVLLELLRDRNRRRDRGIRSRRFMESSWNEEHVLDVLFQAYGFS